MEEGYFNYSMRFTPEKDKIVTKEQLAVFFETVTDYWIISEELSQKNTKHFHIIYWLKVKYETPYSLNKAIGNQFKELFPTSVRGYNQLGNEDNGIKNGAYVIKDGIYLVSKKYPSVLYEEHKKETFVKKLTFITERKDLIQNYLDNIPFKGNNIKVLLTEYMDLHDKYERIYNMSKMKDFCQTIQNLGDKSSREKYKNKILDTII